MANALPSGKPPYPTILHVHGGQRQLLLTVSLQRILVTGGSYGGYLTLQSLSKYPDLWAGGMAEVAISDWFLILR